MCVLFFCKLLGLILKQFGYIPLIKNNVQLVQMKMYLYVFFYIFVNYRRTLLNQNSFNF